MDIHTLERQYYYHLNRAAAENGPAAEFHKDEAARLKKEINNVKRQRPKGPRFYLVVEGFLPGRLVVQELPLSKPICAALEDQIGIEARGLATGKFRRMLAEHAPELSNREQDLVEKGVEMLKELQLPEPVNLHIIPKTKKAASSS